MRDFIRDLWNTKDVFTNTIGSVLSTIFIATIVFIWKKNNSKQQVGLDGQIAVEYWRLFGGRSVCLIMKLFEHRHVITPDETYNPEYERIKYEDDSDDLIFHTHYKIYAKIIKDRDLRVSRKLLWEKYSGDLEIGTWKDFLAKRPNDIETFQLINDNDLNSGMSIEDYPSFLSWKKHTTKMKDLTGQVGYLFFNVKNISTTPIIGAEVIFKKAKVERFLPKAPEGGVRSGGSFERLKGKLKAKGPLEQILPGKNTVPKEDIKFNLGTLEPNSELLFLIEVYRSDSNGYEELYLDDIYRPDLLRHNTSAMKIRQPLRDLSIRELVPDGWFRQ